MDQKIKEALELIKRYGIDGYNRLDDDLKANEAVQKRLLLSMTKKRLEKCNIIDFSILKRIETKVFFDGLKDNMAKDYLAKQFYELFKKISIEESNKLIDFCIDVADSPEDYSRAPSDIKYNPLVAKYITTRIIPSYREHFDDPVYEDIFRDIEDEIRWASFEYKSRNIKLFKDKNNK